MDAALVIGGTRFVGRHTVSELIEAGYDVTLFNRGEHENPFADDDRVARVEGDRTNEGALELAAERVDPDVVIDCVAYRPREVRAATTVFADADAYVYVSSAAAYGAEEIPKREDDTPLRECTREQATDDSMESYGPRKAEGDRAIVEAAGRGVRAMSVRPPVIYGPHDYTDRLAFWVARVRDHDRVLVPGDGQNLRHRAYAPDVARAIRVVAEAGEAGAAYNVGDRRLVTLAELVDLLGDVLDESVETVTASARELSIADLAPEDYPLYRTYPHVLDTARLASLGWDATPVEEALATTANAHLDRDGGDAGPERTGEERVLDVLDTV